MDGHDGYGWEPLIEAARQAENDQAMREIRACTRQLRELAKLWLVMPKLDRPIAGFPLTADEATRWVVSPPPPEWQTDWMAECVTRCSAGG